MPFSDNIANKPPNMDAECKKSSVLFMPQVLALMPVFTNAFMAGCAANWLPNAVFFLTQPNHTPYATELECSHMASLFELGKIVFAIPGGILTEQMGRKNVLLGVGVLNFLSWTLLTADDSLITIYVVRFFLGLSAAIFNTTSSAFIGEIASPHLRGTLNSIQRVAWNAGLVFEALVCVAFPTYAALTNFTAVSTLCFFPTIRWLMESPYYLTKNGREAHAKRNLKVLYPRHLEREIHEELFDIKQCIDQDKCENTHYCSLTLLKQRYVQKLFLCAILINALTMASGGAWISLHITKILPENRYLTNNSYPLVYCILTLLSSMVSPMVIDVMPRRVLFIFCGFAAFFIQLFNNVVYYQYNNDKRNAEYWMWSFMAGNFVYMAVSGGLTTSLFATVKSEIFPFSLRGLGNGICTSIQAAATVFCYEVFTIVEQQVGLQTNYIIFAANSLLLVWVVNVLLPETKGKTLAEIQKAFSHPGEPTVAAAAPANDQKPKQRY